MSDLDDQLLTSDGIHEPRIWTAPFIIVFPAPSPRTVHGLAALMLSVPVYVPGPIYTTWSAGHEVIAEEIDERLAPEEND